jgi:hypothetical protein
MHSRRKIFWKEMRFRDTILLLEGDRDVSQVIQEGFHMLIKKIREIAKKNGVNPGKMNRTDLIRAIQRAEGNPDCFATPHVNECNQVNCLWREDCKAEVVAILNI